MKPHPATRIRSKGLTATILKVLGLFTGVEFAKIFCSIVKMKLVSLWLHAAGVGLFGIFSTTMETIATFSDLGLRQSVVRNVAVATKEGPSRLSLLVAIARRCCCFAGLLGAVIILGLSPLLSKIFLDSPSKWWMFGMLAASMLFNSLLNGEQGILQGTARMKQIAKSALWGNLIGLLVSIPMFRFWGLTSVPLSILVYSISMILSIAVCRFRPPAKVKPTLPETIKEGGAFVKFGAYMAIAAFASNLSQVSFMGYLDGAASLAEVGHFQAGYAIIVRYFGLVFVAIGMELYPRLAANSFSRHRMQLFISHELSLLLSVVAPLIIVFLMCRGLIVRVLYSSEFLDIVPFITIGIFGCVLRTISVTFGFVILARGDGKTFMMTECIDALVWIVAGISFYRLWGLTGLGVAYVVWYAVYLAMVGTLYRKKYRMTLHGKTIRKIISAVAGCCIAVLATSLLTPLYYYPILSLLLVYYLLTSVRFSAITSPS